MIPLLLPDSPLHSAVNAFGQDTRPMFILLGGQPQIEPAIADVQSYLKGCEQTLYIPLNMEQGKHDTAEETYFEVVQQLLNALLDVIADGEGQTQLSALFRLIWNLRNKIRNSENDLQLAEFMRFTHHSCYPILRKTLRNTEQPIVVGLEQFEHVMMWSSKLYNVILEDLLDALADIPLRFVIFVRSDKKPDFFYGSNEEGSKERVVFYDVSKMNRHYRK